MLSGIALAGTWYVERDWFASNSGTQVNGLRGYIHPGSIYNYGGDFVNYNEHEIFLNNNDLIEFISSFYMTPNGWSSDVKVAIFDNNGDGQTLLQINYGNAPQTTYYELYMDNGIYTIKLTNTLTGQVYSTTYNDVDNPSTKIGSIAGSTEVYWYNDGQGTFYSIYPTKIALYWVRENGNWYRPNTKFTYSSGDNYPHVDTQYEWKSDGSLETTHTINSN